MSDPTPSNRDAHNGASDARIGLPPGYPFRPDDEISPRRLHALLHDGTRDGTLDTPARGAVFLLDVRTQLEAEICAIPGSRLAPLQSLEAQIDDLKAEVDDDLTRPIVVYCHHGRRSLTATFLLRAAGFRDVRSLAGGIDLWARDIDRSFATY
jgi:rhodanese-related sulfurtransferase